MSASPRCAACGSPLASDQRYCLTCGERVGSRPPQLPAMLGRPAGPRSGPGERAGAISPEPPVAAGFGAGLRLPGPRISVLLVLAFLGFGALLGSAGASSNRLAASGPLKVVVPPAATAGTAPGAGTSGKAPEASEPPETQPEEPTPEAQSPQAKIAPASEGKGKETEKSEAAPHGSKGGEGGASSRQAKLTDIGHVFLIVLSDQPYAANFGPESKNRYLSQALERKGELLIRYDAIAHEQLPNGIALLSGQGPTVQTAANCPTYGPLTPASAGAQGQVLGDGCVYPSSVETLPGQLTGKHLAWRAYVQGMDEAGAQTGPCAHPALGAADPTATAGAYATYRNPFVYFESLTASPSCQAQNVGLDRLKADLAGVPSRVPSFSYIVPDRCHDAGPSPCSPAAAAGPANAASFLEQVVPRILASKAYKKDGLLVITADEAPATGELGDSSACCGQPPYPNLISAGLRHGGGAVGALLLSPFVKGGTTAQEPYNHYSLLRTIEDVFGLGHLGYAALPAVKSFAPSLLNASAKG